MMNGAYLLWNLHHYISLLMKWSDICHSFIQPCCAKITILAALCRTIRSRSRPHEYLQFMWSVDHNACELRWMIKRPVDRLILDNDTVGFYIIAKYISRSWWIAINIARQIKVMWNSRKWRCWPRSTIPTNIISCDLLYASLEADEFYTFLIQETLTDMLISWSTSAISR